MIADLHCPNCGHQWSLSAATEGALAETAASDAETASGSIGVALQSEDEPMEFEDVGEELAAFTTTAPTVHVILKLTDRQLRDVLYSTSSIGASALYISILIFISLAFQGFFVVVGTLSLLGSNNARLAHVAWLVAIYVVALTTLASAMLLGNYASRLREFVRSKEPESLIASLQSGSRFWLWTAVVMTFALGLGAMSFFALLSDYS